MTDRTHLWLALAGALALVLAGSYGGMLFVSADRADLRSDARSAALLRGLLDRADKTLSETLEHIAVSDEAYQAGYDPESFCATSAAQAPALAIYDSSGSIVLACQFGAAAPAAPAAAFVAGLGAADVSWTEEHRAIQLSHGVALSEYYPRIVSGWVGERYYRGVAAPVVPSVDRPAAPTDPRHFALTYAVIDSHLLRTATEELGLLEVATSPTGVDDRARASIVIGEGADEAVVSWTASRAFRDQLFATAPGVIALTAILLAIIGLALRRVGNLFGRLQAEEAAVRHAAYHDAMTGMPNRARYFHLLAEAMADPKRKAPVYVALFDLDYFKKVNDTYGHDAGDMLLIKVANRVSKAIGPGNTLARLGGDEFALLIRDVRTPDELAALCGRIYDAVPQPIEWNGAVITPSCSLGLAAFPNDGAQADTLIKAADLALYAAKRAGRGCWRLYEAEPAPTAAAA